MALFLDDDIPRHPVLWAASDRGGVDLVEYPSDVFGRDALESIVGTDEIDVPFDRHPVPTGSEHDRRSRSCSQVAELAPPTTLHHEADDECSVDGMGDEPRVHDRRVR